MNASEITDASAELATLRALAEEGRNRPLLGGTHFVVWGCAIAIASLTHMAIVTGALPWPPLSLAGVWLALMTGAAIVARVATKSRKPQNTVGNRVEHEVWRAGGSVLAVTSLAILAFAYLQMGRTGSPDAFRLFAMLPPLTFGVYAIALAASAAAARADYLRPYAALSVAFLVLTTLLAGDVWQIAAQAAGALTVSVLPGFILIRHERRYG